LIDKIAAIAHLHPWIIPYSCSYILNRQGSLGITKTGRIELPQGICSLEVEKKCFYYGGLMNVVSRKAFEKIGGMDERFVGWGEEDSSFARALDTLVGKHYRMDETIFHLWHPPANCYHPHREFNKRLENRYRQVEGNIRAMKRLLKEQ
jgi:predicted glycosyltransferase involved in capsule biosynthesis